MAPYPQNLSLVISTTSDVHDQITDLLESLEETAESTDHDRSAIHHLG